MKRISPLFFLLLSISAFGQNLSGVINTYAKVNSVDSCTATFVVTTTNGFNVGEKILIMQMQGATINESDSDAFGDILDMGSAGRYEIATVASKSLITLTLQNKLVNAYDPDGTVQIISYPTYTNATITDTVKAMQWNGSVGGVVAFEVIGDLTFNAPIDVSGTGFLGGKAIPISNQCIGGINVAPDYFYALSDWRGAQKGTGIANTISGKENGRGAQANGGGGGNDHNSGGGGGANLSAGGQGGERITAFISGDCKGNRPGEAGKAIPTSPNRIFMGGGGGAGHDNNNFATDGGAGGGIVFINSNTLSGNEITLISNGNHAENAIAGDGGGGGGAGGTIYLRAASINGMVRLTADGGNGGDVNNEGTDFCMGPGGGGSGGAIFSELPNTGTITNQIQPGNRGDSKNSTRNNCGDNNATVGEPGFIQDNNSLTFVESTEQFAPLAFVNEPPQSILTCENEDLKIGSEATGTSLNYQWQIQNGMNFDDLSDDAFFSGTNSDTLRLANIMVSMDQTVLRLVISDFCGGTQTSREVVITVNPATDADFTVTDNSPMFTFTNTSSNATSFIWDFGDGTSSTQMSPTHEYTSTGTYSVCLTASGTCGTATHKEMISINSKPGANFSADVLDGCAPLQVTFTNQSTANPDNIMWVFPGGTPATSTNDNVVVTYSAPGSYDVRLIASNALGSDTLLQQNYITIIPPAVADFSVSLSGNIAIFTDQSGNADSYSWDFGDGNSSSNPSPTHSYDQAGSYTVTLTVTNQCGSDTHTQTISTGNFPIAAFNADRAGGCAPHFVQFTDNSSADIIAREWFFPGGDPIFSTDSMPRVFYTTPGFYDVRLVVTNSVGVDTLFQDGFVAIQPRPFAGFDFSVVDNSVTFQNNSTNALEFEWNFGDGSPISREENPNHVFPGPGNYFVTLNANNDFCSGSITIAVAIGGTDTKEIDANDLVQVFPNPATDQLHFQWIKGDFPKGENQIHIYDLNGKTVFSERNIESATTLQIGDLAPSMYFLRFVGAEVDLMYRFVKE